MSFERRGHKQANESKKQKNKQPLLQSPSPAHKETSHPDRYILLWRGGSVCILPVNVIKLLLIIGVLMTVYCFLKPSISQKVYSEITEYALTLFPDPSNLTFGMSGHIDPIKASLSPKT